MNLRNRRAGGLLPPCRTKMTAIVNKKSGGSKPPPYNYLIYTIIFTAFWMLRNSISVCSPPLSPSRVHATGLLKVNLA